MDVREELHAISVAIRRYQEETLAEIRKLRQELEEGVGEEGEKEGRELQAPRQAPGQPRGKLPQGKGVPLGQVARAHGQGAQIGQNQQSDQRVPHSFSSRSSSRTSLRTR